MVLFGARRSKPHQELVKVALKIVCNVSHHHDCVRRIHEADPLAVDILVEQVPAYRSGLRATGVPLACRAARTMAGGQSTRARPQLHRV